VKGSERQKLKHDKAAETMVTGLGWAKHHLSIIIAVFVALVVIVGGAFWLAASRRQAADQASQMLEDAQRLANSVLTAKAQGGSADMDTVVRQFNQIATDNPGTAVAAQALLSAGQLLLTSGSAQQALGYLERASAVSTELKLSGLRAMATRGMAEALEAMGKPEKAIEQYMRFTSASFDPEAVRACWDIGRCYEELKDRKQAEESYNHAVKFGEKSEWANLAAFRLSELAAGAELLGPVTVKTETPAGSAAATAAGSPATPSVVAPAPAAPEKPAAKAPAQENPAPPAAPAAAPKTPEQKPADKAQP